MELLQRRRHNRSGRSQLQILNFASLPPSQAAVQTLREELLNATVGMGIVPAVYALAGKTEEMPPVVDCMPDFAVDVCSAEIAYAHEVEVTNMPPPIAFLPHRLFPSVSSEGYTEERDRFLAEVNMAPETLPKIAEITAGQCKNIEWLRQRMGAVTSSKFGQVARCMRLGRYSASLIKSVLGYRYWNCKTVPRTNAKSLQWGLVHEAAAREMYLGVMKDEHSGLNISLPGLLVDAANPFIRASPDGVVSCTCHSVKWIVEIKCPYSVRTIDPLEAVENGMLKYISKHGDEYRLLPNQAAGYYEQIQGCMAIVGVKHCHFVVWTEVGELIIPVDFDSTFWNEQLLPSIINFFHAYIVPEILTERVRNGLQLLDKEQHDSDAAPAEPNIDYCSDTCAEQKHTSISNDSDDCLLELVVDVDMQDEMQQYIDAATAEPLYTDFYSDVEPD